MGHHDLMSLTRLKFASTTMVIVAATLVAGPACAAPGRGPGGNGSGVEVTSGGYRIGAAPERVGPQQKILAVVEPYIPEILRPIVRRQVTPRPRSGGRSANFGASTMVPLLTTAAGFELGVGFGRPKQERTASPDAERAMVVVVYVARNW